MSGGSILDSVSSILNILDISGSLGIRTGLSGGLGACSLSSSERCSVSEGRFISSAYAEAGKEPRSGSGELGQRDKEDGAVWTHQDGGGLG